MFSIDDEPVDNSFRTVTIEKCFYKTQRGYTYGFQWPAQDTDGFYLNDNSVTDFERVRLGGYLAFVTISDGLLNRLGWKCGTVLRWKFYLNDDGEKIIGFKNV